MYSNGTYATGTAHVPGLALNECIDLNGVYVVPVGGRTFHVRGVATTGAILTYDDQYGQNTSDMNRRLYPSVASVLPYCVANRGDKIIVHQNHTEYLAAADSLAFVAGVEIIGLGWGDTRPTFTFTTATSTLLLDVAGVKIRNCRFLCAGPLAGGVALTVAAPFNVSGEGCLLRDNYFDIGIDADQIVGTFMIVKGANLGLFGNKIVAAAAAAPVTSCIVLGATGLHASGFTAIGNYIKTATSAATVGVIENVASTAASTDMIIERNYLHNWTAISSAVISFHANAVMTGTIRENIFRVELNSSVQGVVYDGTGVDMTLDNNRIGNVANETAKQNQGTVSA
jgi:hypothetical protein